MNVDIYLNKVKKGEISIVDYIKSVIKEARVLNKEYKFFNFISESAIERAEELEKNPKGKLAGLPISVKDCICVKNMEL